MSFIHELWQPILLSAFLAFVISALAWTMLPHHKKELTGLAGEDAVIDAIRKSNPAPGRYVFPCAEDPKARHSPEAMKRWAEGPSGMVTIMPKGPMGMGKMMVQQFVFFVVTSVFVAYLTSHTVAHNAIYLTVFRVSGTAAILAYVFGTIPESIWFGRPWKSFWLGAIDGVLYGLVTAGSFGWLWPRG
jgi:hypothetical protein